jgi:flagellar protein FliL
MPTMTDKAGKVAADAKETGDAPESPKKKKSRKKLLIVVVLVLVVGVGAKFELGGSAKKPGANAAAAVAAKPGPMVALDAVTVNLAGGHYLRIGVTVQFTDKVSATAPPDGTAATDQTIGYFTGQDAAALETPAGLATAKAGLKTKIAAAYPKDPLYDVLFTSFVVQ